MCPLYIVSLLEKSLHDLNTLPTNNPLTTHDGVLAASSIELALRCIKILGSFDDVPSNQDILKLDSIFRKRKTRLHVYSRRCYLSVSNVETNDMRYRGTMKDEDISHALVS